MSTEFFLKVEQIEPKHVTPTISLLLVNNMPTKSFVLNISQEGGGFVQRLV